MSKVTARPPVVERIAGWSADHKKTAVFGWLFLIVAAVVIGGMTGSKTPVKSYSPGEAGRSERALDASGISQDSESVLVQSLKGGTFAADKDFRQAVTDVTAALRGMPDAAKDIRSPLDASPDCHGAGRQGRPLGDGHVQHRRRQGPDRRHCRQAARGRRRDPDRRIPACGSRRPAPDPSTRRSKTSSPPASSAPSSARCR